MTASSSLSADIMPGGSVAREGNAKHVAFAYCQHVPIESCGRDPSRPEVHRLNATLKLATTGSASVIGSNPMAFQFTIMALGSPV
jgi:hypothetical protein